MVDSPAEEELPWQEAARTLFELRAEEWTRIIAAGLWKRHPMLRSQVQDLAHEALVRTYVVWQRDPEKRDRNPLPYARDTAKNLANDAYDKLAEPADEAGLQECERVFVARPSRASDLHGDYAGLVPHTGMTRSSSGSTGVAEMRSQGMEDQAIAGGKTELARFFVQLTGWPLLDKAARVRRGFRNLHAKTGTPAGAPKPTRPGPGRPVGSKNRQPATRYDVGRVLATGEPYARPAHHKKGTKPRRGSSPATPVQRHDPDDVG